MLVRSPAFMPRKDAQLIVHSFSHELLWIRQAGAFDRDVDSVLARCRFGQSLSVGGDGPVKTQSRATSVPNP